MALLRHMCDVRHLGLPPPGVSSPLAPASFGFILKTLMSNVIFLS